MTIIVMKTRDKRVMSFPVKARRAAVAELIVQALQHQTPLQITTRQDGVFVIPPAIFNECTFRIMAE